MTDTKINKYSLFEYEVWGNDQDGYEVNNMYLVEDDLMISEDSTNEEILKFLRCSKHVEIENNCCSWPHALYFNDKRNGKPLGELRLA